MSVLAEQRKAYYDYEILEKFQAGLILSGFEVKAMKAGKVSLVGSRVIVRAGEAFALGINVTPYQAGNAPEDFDPQRTIKLLLQKKEINYLTGKLNQKGLTIVPLKLHNVNNRLKLEIGLVRGKKQFDKREAAKKREAKRNIERILKEGR